MSVMTRAVLVEAPARLHFGMLDLGGSLGRRFGGIGAAVPDPSLLIEVAPANELRGEGPDSTRAVEFARRFLAHYGFRGGAHIRVRRALPGHSGLGSGTQLALAVARALAEIHALPEDPAALARAVGRGARSAVGTWVFAHGGFILEGGRRPEDASIAPLLARLRMPESWRCILAIPRARTGLSGSAEARALASLTPGRLDAERIAHLVLMALLPAVAEGDLAAFGAALTEIQRINGGWFAPIQGGAFASGGSAELVALMTARGVPGVGQSSWGPAVYGVVDGDAAAAAVASELRDVIGEGLVYEGPFANAGASVHRAPASAHASYRGGESPSLSPPPSASSPP